MVEALVSGKEGVSSAARRFRLRCLKHVILLLGQQSDEQPAADEGSEEGASAQQQVTPPPPFPRAGGCVPHAVCMVICMLPELTHLY